MSLIENLFGSVNVSVGDIGENPVEFPLEPNDKMTIGGASPGDPASTLEVLTSQSSTLIASLINQMMKIADKLQVSSPGIHTIEYVKLWDEAPGGGRCNPDADTFQTCEDGQWIWETGECICSVICPTFLVMQSCNAHVHWGCLWIGNACFDTTTEAVLTVETNCYCRSGPGLMYPAITSFPLGTKLQVLGSSDAFGALWWQVQIPEREEPCWISGRVGQSSLPVGQLPQVPPPATPTPKPQEEDRGGGGGLTCNMLATTKEECGDGFWDCTGSCECDCSVLCPNFADQSSCQAHASWFCSWNGSACVGP